MPFSDFIAKESLGKGSFGDVKRVVRRADGKEYAMKEVPVGNLSRKEVKDAVNEVRLLASLRHPNVIGFLEVCYFKFRLMHGIHANLLPSLLPWFALYSRAAGIFR